VLLDKARQSYLGLRLDDGILGGMQRRLNHTFQANQQGQGRYVVTVPAQTNLGRSNQLAGLAYSLNNDFLLTENHNHDGA
jgi:hypothetical protein